MNAITKEGSSYSKKAMDAARFAHIASRTSVFYHKATVGTGSINLNALTLPPELTGVEQISPAEITGARLYLSKKNLLLSSSVLGLLEEGKHYAIGDSQTIVLLATGYPTGAAAGEVFTGRIFGSPISDIIVASAKHVVKTYNLAVGQTTLNLGHEFRVNEFPEQNIGIIKVWRDGSLKTRNTLNSSSVLDRDYYEVHAGNGYGTILEFNVAPVGTAAKIVVDFGVRAITDNNAFGDLEALHTALLKIATDLATLTSEDVDTYILANPSETERRAFGDLVLSLKAQGIDHESRIVALEGSTGGSEVVNSMAGTQTDKAPSVQSVKDYVLNSSPSQVVNSTAGSETAKAPSVASIKSYADAKVVNSTAGSETTAAPSVSAMKAYADAKVVNATTGSETTSAPSVASMKSYVQAYVAPTNVPAALVIDWSLSQVFRKVVTVNSTFTFSNVTDGKVITLVVFNSSGADVTLTLPTSIRDANFSLVVPAGKFNTYTFIRTNTETLAVSVAGMA